MNRIIATCAAVVVLLVGPAETRAAGAQNGSGLVGTWRLTSNMGENAGRATEPFGQHPTGMLILGSDGYFEMMNLRADLPTFASGFRGSGSSAENASVVRGSIGLFGTYTVNGHTLVLHVEKSTFPNWDRTEQLRPFTLSGSQLTYTISAASAAPGSSRVIWTRAKSGNHARQRHRILR